MSDSEWPEFQELLHQDVREYWQHEAHDFTPWLADSIEARDPSHLEDILGLDLEVIETERSVGRYNLDILAKDVDDNRQVVIENQLAQFDHDHLGKAIAYAAGIDADIIVWIAPTFNDEHRDAIEWLNQNSREGIDLFAVRLEVWKIGDSSPAIRLNPLENPSEWKRKAQRSGGEITAANELREEFWTQFRDRIEQSKTRLRARKPRTRNFYSNPIGKSGFHISFIVSSKDEELRVDLIIEDDEEAFYDLKSDQEAIERELGRPVEWDEPRKTSTGKMRSIISVVREGDVENRSDWDEYFDWFFEVGERFHDVFSNRLQSF